jgi:glutamate--cysteine ligase
MTEKEKSKEIRHKSQLIEYFELGNKPREKWGIGTENEKFLFRSDDFKRLKYSKILDVLTQMMQEGWSPVNERGEIIALQKNGASITLEPGGQFELSGENFKTIHETYNETKKHFEELNVICREFGFFSLPLGVDPLTSFENVPWMPKERYRWMKNYMPDKGKLGLQMMATTASIQVNLDYADETDMVKKMRVAQALQPIVTAIFANSPFSVGKPNGYLNYRAHIWDHTDPDRCGFLPFIFDTGFGFERWVDYLLDIPMYFIFRDDNYFSADGMTFRKFLERKHSFIPIMEDWELHISTVFPDVRLKQFIEMRGADASCVSHVAALSSLWVGLLYDAQSLEEAYSLISGWNLSDIREVRAQVPQKALKAESGNINAGKIASQIYQIAFDGLTRRSEVLGIESENLFLAPVREISASGITQAEILLQLYNENFDKDLLKLINNWQKEQIKIYMSESTIKK